MLHYTRETIRIPSVQAAVFLDVWLYKPLGEAPYPLVVAGHGYALLVYTSLIVQNDSHKRCWIGCIRRTLGL